MTPFDDARVDVMGAALHLAWLWRLNGPDLDAELLHRTLDSLVAAVDRYDALSRDFAANEARR